MNLNHLDLESSLWKGRRMRVCLVMVVIGFGEMKCFDSGHCRDLEMMLSMYLSIWMFAQTDLMDLIAILLRGERFFLERPCYDLGGTALRRRRRYR